MSGTVRHGLSRSKPPQLPERLFDAVWLGKQIGIPHKDWPLNCYAVAAAILQLQLLPRGRAAYGHYFGEISPRSIFASRAGLAPRHGWVTLSGGWIYDPTRWVFTATKPLPVLVHMTLVTGDNALPDYDLGGEHFMKIHSDVRPPTDAQIARMTGPQAAPFNMRFPKGLHGLLCSLFGRHTDLKLAHIHYLATRGPRFLGKLAPLTYQFISGNGLQALIPLDYRNEVLGTQSRVTNQVEQWRQRLAHIRDELMAVSNEINELGGVTEDCKELMDEVVELLSRNV